jgi:hypothetical protein
MVFTAISNVVAGAFDKNKITQSNLPKTTLFGGFAQIKSG